MVGASILMFLDWARRKKEKEKAKSPSFRDQRPCSRANLARISGRASQASVSRTWRRCGRAAGPCWRAAPGRGSSWPSSASGSRGERARGARGARGRQSVWLNGAHNGGHRKLAWKDDKAKKEVPSKRRTHIRICLCGLCGCCFRGVVGSAICLVLRRPQLAQNELLCWDF